MRYEARRYVIAVLVILLVGVAYSQTQVDDENVLTKDSQETIRPEVTPTPETIDKAIKENTNTEDADNKKLEDSKEVEKKDDTEKKAAENNEAAPAAPAASKARSFRATAYCLRGRTASGQRVRKGLIAADPRVLPLGTRVRLTAGRYSGTYTVADTGGKIKGSKIDIWMPSCGEARRWGNRRVKLTVLSRKRK
ncbi:MAG: hypothetical protein DWQ47_12730 [Acidobacteria bacterium]|nr:MAG: hypothetical protein DWQ32_00130 [Acidobacteriota bacterium]REK03049.1 MAG: hypothetical protein DWQ38_12005 [Acidobacteriota bacterium]REK13147.1 MAG: hypothetical protein DWQ43_05820 [Acidobacteriota bacterium]REK41141.1 MAG: hypothetical protein DWQ47_12730 [Acidobacteriota bacterium]